jgi:UDP-glucose 4-epimerase
MGIQLVTGGLGFIGSHLVEALVKQGRQVRVLDDASTGNRQNISAVDSQVEVVFGDITDEQVLQKSLQSVDVVYHHAALASVPRSLDEPLATHRVCATGTLMLLDQARRSGVRRIVYAASSSAYGNSSTGGSKHESDLPQPLSPYAAAKLAGEFYCLTARESFGLPAVCLRYFNVFGPRQDPNGPYAAVIPRFITSMLAGEAPTIYGDGLQSRDFIFVQNVVDANLAAADHDRAVGHVFNVGAGQATSLLDLVQLINQALGTNIAPRHETPRAGDVRDSCADISLIQSQLGYRPRIDLQEGLSRTIAWFRNQAASQNR